MAYNRSAQILLVDDDPDVLELLSDTLRAYFPGELGIKTTTNPVEAKNFLETELIDVLITDLKMPEVSGLELLRCAKRRNPWTQVVIITGNSTLDAMTDVMDLGANDYLLKPLVPGILDQVIDAILSRHRRCAKLWPEPWGACLFEPT